MFKQVHIYLFISLVLFLTSCEREFVFEDEKWDNPIVLNGLLTANSMPVSVYLYHSQKITDTTNIVAIENATVWLETKGQTYHFEHTEMGRYICQVAPEPGQTYRVKALVKGDTVWSETTIPSPSVLGSVTLDSLGFNSWAKWHYNFNINDEKGVKNNYWFWVFELESNDSLVTTSPSMLSSKSPYPDKTWVTKDPGAAFGYTLDYGPFMRVPDTSFDGEKIAIDIFSVNISWGNNGLFYMASFDEHYDKYMKNYLSHANYLSMMDDLAIYYQPSFIYSNVQNGSGILGSMALKDTIISDIPLFQNYQK